MPEPFSVAAPPEIGPVMALARKPMLMSPPWAVVAARMPSRASPMIDMPVRAVMSMPPVVSPATMP